MFAALYATIMKLLPLVHHNQHLDGTLLLASTQEWLSHLIDDMTVNTCYESDYTVEKLEKIELQLFVHYYNSKAVTGHTRETTIAVPKTDFTTLQAALIDSSFKDARSSTSVMSSCRSSTDIARGNDNNSFVSSLEIQWCK